MDRKILLASSNDAFSTFNGSLCLAFFLIAWSSNSIASPQPPSDINGVVYSRTAGEIFWQRSSSDEPVINYEIYRNDKLVSTRDATSYFDNSLSRDADHEYFIVAVDAQGARSKTSAVVMLSTRYSGSSINSSEPEQEGREQPDILTTASLPTNDEAQTTGTAITLTSPTNGATLPGASFELAWSTNRIDAIQWWVHAGVSADDKSLYDSGRITNASTRRHTIRGLPTDGSKVHVQLGYKKSSGAWEIIRYLFNATAPTTTATAASTTDEYNPFAPSNGLALVSPENRATLPGTSFELLWEADDIKATQWIVRAGSTVNGSDIYDSGRIFVVNARRHMLTGMPTDGSKIHLALSYKIIEGNWITERYIFTAATTAIAAADQSQTSVTSGNVEQWSNTETPPPMNASKFTVVRQLNQLKVTYWNPRGQNNFHCRGDVYTITGSGKDNDLFLDASSWGTVTQPIIIKNFRNVIILGLDIEATTIPGCGAGERLMFWRGPGYSWPNDHPHLPADRLLGFEIYGVSWVEGNHSRMKGHAADHIVTNGGPTQTSQQVNADRWTKIVNSRHTGAEGNSAGIHGDWAENHDSGDQLAQAGFVAENSTSKSAYNHAVTGYRGDSRWGVIKIHNVMLANDPDYHTDQVGTGRVWQLRPDEINGLCLVGAPRVWDIKRLMCQPAGETLRASIKHSGDPVRYIYAPLYHDGTPTNRSAQGSGILDRSELIEIKGGWENDSYLDPAVQAWIAENDPALPENVGNRYVSPWQDLYSTY